MRAVVQRVSSASVAVAGERISSMGAGLLALVGVGRGDAPETAREMARRLVHLRVFADAAGRMNHSLLDRGGALGVVSQFTLYGDTRQGRRPYFGAAAASEEAQPLIAALVAAVEAEGVPVIQGRFGAAMEVTLVGDGPVTLLLDSDRQF